MRKASNESSRFASETVLRCYIHVKEATKKEHKTTGTTRTCSGSQRIRSRDRRSKKTSSQRCLRTRSTEAKEVVSLLKKTREAKEGGSEE